MDEIKIMKLTTSEEVIAYFVEETDSVIRVKKPWGIAPNPTGNGLSVYPFSVTSIRAEDEDIFEINKSAVVMLHEAPVELATSYRNRTSKLYVAPSVDEKSLILG